MKHLLYFFIFLCSLGFTQAQTAFFKAYSYATFTEADCYGCGLKTGSFSGTIVQIGTIKHALHNPIKAKWRGAMVDLEDAFGYRLSVRISNIGGYSVGTNLTEFLTASNTIEASGSSGASAWSEYPATQTVNMADRSIDSMGNIKFDDSRRGLLFQGGGQIRQKSTVDDDGLLFQTGDGDAIEWRGGIMYIMNPSSEIVYQIYNTATPTVDDDETKQYIVGSVWVMRNRDEYVCSDITDGAAVWNLQSTTVNVSDVVGLQDSLNAKANSLGVDDNYVTDAEKTKLSNLSGTNTGDQDLSGLVVKANNLSDLTNTSTARTNLGLGTLATQSGTFSGTSSGTNTGDNAVNSNYSGLVTNATHTGDATGSGALTVVGVNGTNLAGLGTGVLKNTAATGVPFISKVALTEPATAATITVANNQTLTVNGSATITNGTHSGTNTGDQDLSGKQDVLVSGTNLRSVNGTSLLGSGNIAAVPTGGTAGQVLAKVDGTDYNDAWVTPSAPSFTGANINLDNTRQANQFGYIQKGAVNWLHDYVWGLNGNAITPDGRNIFLGLLSGNATLGQTATVVTQSSENVGIGYNTLTGLTTGYKNTILGTRAGTTLTTGYHNVAIGFQAMLTANTAYDNVAIGRYAIGAGASGNNNVAIGSTALQSVTGSNSIGIGNQALLSQVSGSYNIGIGYEAGYSNNSTSDNISIGQSAGRGVTTASNISIGKWTMYGGAGADNVAIGKEAMFNGGSGYSNVAVGNLSLRTIAGGYQNVSLGSRPLYSNSTGNNNVGIGFDALFALTATSDNIGIGNLAGRYIADGVTANSAPTNSIYIGLSARPSANTQTNQIVIGANAVGNGSNSITLGHTDITKTIMRAGVGIDQTSPTAKLHLGAGTASASAAPLKFTAGTVLTTPEVGVMETNTNSLLYFSNTTSNRGLVEVNYYTAKSANYTALITDNIINCTANTFTVTLPTAVGFTGKAFKIKNSGAGVITIDTTSSQTIDGILTQTLNQYNGILVVSDGANWIIL